MPTPDGRVLEMLFVTDGMWVWDSCLYSASAECSSLHHSIYLESSITYDCESGKSVKSSPGRLVFDSGWKSL